MGAPSTQRLRAQGLLLRRLGGPFQNADNSKVWMYPSMRRGRMLYSFDITIPGAQLKWRVGCRTWRTTPAAPAATTISARRGRPRQSRFVRGFHPDNPLVIVGGATTHARTRTSRRPRARVPGSSVYVIDADNGALVKFRLGRHWEHRSQRRGRCHAGRPGLRRLCRPRLLRRRRRRAARIDFSVPATLATRPPTEWTLTNRADTGAGRSSVRASSARLRARLPHDWLRATANGRS